MASDEVKCLDFVKSDVEFDQCDLNENVFSLVLEFNLNPA